MTIINFKIHPPIWVCVWWGTDFINDEGLQVSIFSLSMSPISFNFAVLKINVCFNGEKMAASSSSFVCWVPAITLVMAIKNKQQQKQLVFSITSNFLNSKVKYMYTKKLLFKYLTQNTSWRTSHICAHWVCLLATSYCCGSMPVLWSHHSQWPFLF